MLFTSVQYANLKIWDFIYKYVSYDEQFIVKKVLIIQAEYSLWEKQICGEGNSSNRVVWVGGVQSDFLSIKKEIFLDCDMFQSTGFSLDECRSKCKLTVYCKKSKCLDNSSICHQREICHFTWRSESNDISITHYEVKIAKRNETCIHE